MIVKRFIIFTVFFFFVHELCAQHSVSEEHAYMMVQTVRKFHYLPKEVNDEFSETVFERFIETTDPFGIIWSKSDMLELSRFKNVIDDDILNKESTFLEKISEMYFNRLKEIKSWNEAMLKREINFKENDSIQFSDKAIRYNDEEQKIFRERFLKFRILSECMRAADSLLNEAYFEKEKTKKAQINILKNELCRLESRLTDKESFNQLMNSAYLHSIAYSFDPHTDYFSEKEMDEFESLLSKESASFGISLATDENYSIKIDKLIPGGPAWDSDLLNEGDIILSVQPENDSVQNFECIKLIEAISFLASEDIQKARFRIRKKNGKELSLELKKEILLTEENTINGFILNGREDVGYIRIPSFYSDFEYNSVNGCADDLAKEIIRLKRQGIEGLILDLRDNGGGSLEEAVKAAGLFVDFGAVGILDTRFDDIRILKDKDRGILFNKALIVMINSASASASEFLAAALQDHRRAVIVGSRSFGKSTSQIILPIDAFDYFSGYAVEDIEAEAYIKLTTGIFFRVTGKSHQKEGIIPDIELEDDGYIFYESDLPTAMDTVSAEKKAFYKPLKALPLKMLREKSNARFKPLKIGNHTMLRMFADKKITVPLNTRAFIEFSNTFFQTETDDEQQKAPYQVSSFDYLKGVYSTENSSNEMTDAASDNIKNDRSIFETFSILIDLIHYSKQ